MKSKIVSRQRRGPDSGKSQDIISILLEDHRALKQLIVVMKNTDRSLDERVEAFSQFAPLLLAHAKPEERSLYRFMRTKDDLRLDSFEGEVEHGLADQMVEEAKRTTDPDQLGARIKVLAELVEHHLKEEESEIFPHLEKEVDREMLIHLADNYLAAQAEVISEGEDDAPRERDLRRQDLYQNPTH